MMFGRGYNGISNGFCNGYMFGGRGMILVAILAIIAIAAIIYFKRKTNNHKPSNEAMNVLKLKYVKGEISEEEYMKKKNTLDL